MLPALLGLALVLSAQETTKATLEGVTILHGAPRGDDGAAPSLRAHLRISGLKGKPRLRLWKTDAAGVSRVASGRLAQRLGTGTFLLTLEAQGGPDSFELTAPWPGTPSPEDRVVVEAFLGRRRVAWATSGIALQPRRGAAPRQD